MRALAFVPVLCLLAACEAPGKKLEHLTWGKEFEAHPAPLDPQKKETLDDVVARAKAVLQHDFPNGLDPVSKEDQGDLWTIWRYDTSVSYRDTKRTKAHVKIEDLGKGKFRIGVAVVQQTNDNIDNPSVIKEARWVNTMHLPEVEQVMEERIAQRYLNFQPSKSFMEQHADKPSKTLRSDLLDRYKDVDLQGLGKIDPNRKTPTVTGPGKDDPDSGDEDK